MSHQVNSRRELRETLGIRTSEEYGLMWLNLVGGRDTLVFSVLHER